MRSRILLFVVFVLAVSASAAEAATCTSVASGSFNAAGTWSCDGAGTVPAAGDAVIIAAGTTVSRAGSEPSLKSLTVQAGATLFTDPMLDAGGLVVTDRLDVHGGGVIDSTEHMVELNGIGAVIASTGSSSASRGVLTGDLSVGGTASVEAGANITVKDFYLQDSSRVDNNGHVRVTGTLTAPFVKMNPVWAQQANSVLELYSQAAWQVGLESVIPNEIAFRGSGEYRLPDSWGPDSGVQYDSVRVEMETPNDMVLVSSSNPLVANHINIVQGVLADDGYQINDNWGALDLSNVGTLTIGELGQLWIGYHDSYGMTPVVLASIEAAAESSASPRRGTRRARRIESNSAVQSSGLPKFDGYAFHSSSIVRFQGSSVTEISTAAEYGNLVIDNPSSATTTTMTVTHDAAFGAQPLTIAGNLWFGAGSSVVNVDFSTNAVELDVAGDVGPEPPTAWNGMVSPSPSALANLSFASANVVVGGDWLHRSGYSPGSGVWTFNGSNVASAAGGYDLPTPSVPGLVLANGTATWNVDPSSGLWINGNATLMGTLTGGVVTLAGSGSSTLSTSGANVYFNEQVELSANWTISADANVIANNGIFTQGNWVTNLGHVTIEGGTLNSFNDGDMWIQGDGSVLVFNTLTSPAIDGVPLAATGAPNTVVYGGAGNQTIAATNGGMLPASAAYWDLVLQGAGLRAAAAPLSTSGALSVGASVLFQPATSVDVDGDFSILAGGSVDGLSSSFSVAGDWSNLGSFTVNGADVRFDGTAPQTVSASDFASLAFANASGVTLTGAISATVVSIEPSAVLSAGSNTIVVTDLWSNSGVFNAGTGVVTMNSSGSASMSGDTTFNELRFQGATTSIDSSYVVNGTFVIESGASVVTSQGIQTLRGNFINDGTFNGQATAAASRGPRLASTRIAPTSGAGSTVVFSGAAPQSISGTGSTTFFHLDIDNAGGVTQLAPLVSVSSELLLTNGIYSASGANVLHVWGSSPVTRGAGWVSGNLRKDVMSPVATLFEVGTSSGFGPLTVNTSSGSGSVTITSNSGAHPSSANPSLAATRWWQLDAPGFAGIDVTMQWNAADAQGDESQYVAASWDGSIWSTYPSIDLVNRTATITGVASNEFTVGEPNAFNPAVELVITSSETGGTAGDVIPVTITARDAQGNAAAGYDGDVSVVFSGPAAAPDGTSPVALDKDSNEIVLGSSTVLTFVDGVATGAVKLFAVESPASLSVTDGTISSGTPLDLMIAPGAVDHFSWAIGPSQTVGATVSSGSTLTALDAWDNVATGFDASSNPVTVTTDASLSGIIETSAGGATISGSGDFVSGVADLASLGLRYEGTAGTGTLIATAASSASGTSSSVTFAAGAATQLVLVAPGETLAAGVAGGKSGAPSAQQAGAAFTVSVYAMDAFWNPADSSDTVEISSTDSAATLPAAQALSNGSQTFSVTLATAGAHTIQATDLTDSAVTSGTSSLNVNAGAAHHLKIELSSSSAAAVRANATLPGQTAGVAFDVVVTAYDEEGNIATSASDVINFASSDSQATLPPDTALSGGVLNATITLRTAGIPSITASSVTNPGVLPAVVSVSVSPGPLAKFMIEAESGGPIPAQTAGVPFTIRITALDCCGNTVTSFNSSVVVSSDGSLSAGAGSTAAFVNGTTLHTVEFDSDGLYKLFAADSSGKTGQTTVEVGSGCPAAPALEAPANGATGVTSPVTFFWHSSRGAETYRLWVALNGEPFEMVVETEGQLHEMALEGEVQWYVEAVASDCPVATSATHSFTTETVCRPADSPLPSVVGTVLSGERYDVLWDETEGASRFHLQQSRDALFVSDVENFTVEGQSLQFEHQVLEPTAFYYRVAAITDCSNETSAFSPTVRVVVVPQPGPENERWEVTVPFGTATDVVQTIFVPGLETGEVEFIATTDQPWMTVVPDRGMIGPEGLELEVRSNTTALQVGANTGTVFVEYLNTASTGRLRASGNNKKTSVPVSISLVTPVKPAPKTGATASNALIIPAVAHSSGVNSEWRSDVRITNTASQTIRYVLSFTESGTDATVAGKKTEIEIKPNQTVALDDIVRNWYGLGSMNDGVSGVLEIVPQASTGSMPAEALQLATAASSRTYNVTSSGTFGQYIPAIPFSSFIGKSEESNRISKLTLQQISQTSTYRTNIGLVEGSGQPAEVKLTFFDGDGDQVYTRNVTLKAGEQQQINQILATAGVTLEDGRMEVEVVSASGRVTAYASTVDNRTGDPILVPAVKLPLDPAETYVIPGVADLVNSLANWRTDLRVFNPSDAPVPTTLVFYPQNNGGTPVETQVVVPAGGVLQLDNLLRQTFGLQNAGGALHVETPVNADLVVTARTFNETPDGTYGQFIPAVTAADAAGVGDRPIQILQIEESERFRTNLGLVEVTGEPVEVEITVLDPGATATPLRRVQLSGGEFRQLNRIVSSLGLGSSYNTRIAVRVVGGSGRLAAYASVVDNRTQDPTYVPGQ